MTGDLSSPVHVAARPFVLLPPDITSGSVGLRKYQLAAAHSDRTPPGELTTPILGLFGEIGSLLAVIKKKRRESQAFSKYDEALLEELGDSLWYLSAIATHVGLDLSVIAQRLFRTHDDWDEVEARFGTFGDVHPSSDSATSDVVDSMTALAVSAGNLVAAYKGGDLEHNRDAVSAHLIRIFGALVNAASAAGADLDTAAFRNLEKVYSRWPLTQEYPPLSDADMPLNEQLPRRFRVSVAEHVVGARTYVLQKVRGVIIGDRLTDNKRELDDYRFHDVFHVAYAVHLGWSPVLRALFRVKRKSRADLDENEDGARAILIEEGVATFVFGQALRRNLFEGLAQLDYDLLKLVTELVHGFEPERCALWQWERAILDGFAVFRQLKQSRRGFVTADLITHTLTFEPGDDLEGLSP